MNIMWVKLKKTLHYLLKATRAPAGGFVDVFEIRVVETYQTDLKILLKNHFLNKQDFMNLKYLKILKKV